MEAIDELAESQPACVCAALDRGGRVASWTETSDEVLGYRPEDVLGRHLACIYSTEDLEVDLPEQDLSSVARLGHARFEGWRVRRDLKRVYVSMLANTLRDGNGALMGFYLEIFPASEAELPAVETQ